jgi:dihydrofolate reductase
MKTTLYASLSANGHVVTANAGHEIQPGILHDFLAHARRAGNVVIGRRTFDLMRSGGSGSAFAGVDIVVLSRQRQDLAGVHPAGSPEQALQLLADRGHTEALLAGGAAAYQSFLERQLADELVLNVAPVLAGDGPRLSLTGAGTATLGLVVVRRLGEGNAQLHYQVLR